MGTAGCERDGNGTDRERRSGLTAAPVPDSRHLAGRPPDSEAVGARGDAPVERRAGAPPRRGTEAGGLRGSGTADRGARPGRRAARVPARAARRDHRRRRPRPRGRLLSRVRRTPRALPGRHGRLVARRAHRPHRGPPGGARTRPLVGRHGLRRRPDTGRPAAVRLGARRAGEPHGGRAGRHRPAGPLASGHPAGRGRHPRPGRRSTRSGPLRQRADRRDALGPAELDGLRPPRSSSSPPRTWR